MSNLDPRIYRLNAEALAEIKATVDGDSDQDVGHIIYGLLDEIAALTPARQPTCRKCGGTMQPGHALGQTYTSGAPDDLGGEKMRAGMRMAADIARECWNDPQCEVDVEYIPNAILAEMEKLK